jgi:hypothetical protein
VKRYCRLRELSIAKLLWREGCVPPISRREPTIYRAMELVSR